MFQWLNDLLQFFAKFFPHLDVMDPTEAGVAVGGWRRLLGVRRLRVIEPNRLYVWWPILTEILTRDVVRQTLHLRSQTVLVVGEEEEWVDLTVRGVVVYSISDIEKAITKVEDVDEAIGDLAGAAIKAVLFGQSLSDIVEASDKLSDELGKELRKKLYDYGVRIHNVFLSDVCTSQVFRLAGGGIVAAGDG